MANRYNKDQGLAAALSLPPAPTSGFKPNSGGDRSRITPRSQVLVYEVQLKELFDLYPRSPSKERVKGCFAILDEVIPFLGSLSPIIKIIKDELYRSVYSRNLTSSDVEPFVERIPYFCAAGRIDEARFEEVTRTTEALTELQQKIKFRDHDLQILYKKNMVLKQDIAEHESKEKTLLEKIKQLEEMYQKNDMEKGELRIYQASKEEQLKREIEKLQTNLAQANHIIEKLTLFKTAYNENGGDSMVEEEREKSKLELNIDSLGMVEYDIYQAERLDEQFAEILNLQLDDFEMSLSQLRKKREILSGVMNNEGDRESSYKLELHEIVASFRKRVSDLLEEQKLLRTHIASLKVIEDDYTSDKKTINRTADINLRKYATVLHFSEDNGKTFQPYTNAPFCGKCGEKTLTCPHKSLSTEPLQLPPKITHIKVTRPLLKLRSHYGKDSFYAKDLETVEILETEDESLQVSKTMKIVWQQYYDQRGGTKPKMPRVFQLPKLLSLIQEVYDARWSYEEDRIESDLKDDEATLPRFVDFFYDFMMQRYQLPEIALKACHDIFTALAAFETDNASVQIFVKHLCGWEDVLWKYILLTKKLIAKYDNINMAKYRQILAIIYPSRTREMYEQMELELVAFSKNKFSKEMIEDHILHMLATNIEPNQKFFNIGLKRFDYQDTGNLSYEDFDEALGQLLPMASARMKRARYRLAEMDFKKDENSWVPQAIISGDMSMAESAGAKAGGKKGNGESEIDQDEVDKIIKNEHIVSLDQRIIEEEEVKLLRSISPSTDGEFFQQFWKLPENAEDVFNLFTPKDIRKIRDTAPENLETLLRKVSDRLLGFLSLASKPTKQEIQEVLNCVRILTRIMPFLFELETYTLEEKIFWTRTEGNAADIDDRIAPRLMKAVVQLLFFRGWVWASSRDWSFCASDPNRNSYFFQHYVSTVDILSLTLPDMVSETESVKYIIWEKGVGASAAPPQVGALIQNRVEILRLLVTLISRTMYTPSSDVLKTVNKWGVVLASALEKKAVLTLLCSMLNTTMNYDPVGWGLIPYNHVIFTDNLEHLVTLCLDALVAILDMGAARPLQRRSSIVAAPENPTGSTEALASEVFPSEATEEKSKESSGNNEFRFYISKLHRTEDFAYLMDSSASTYLPGANKRVTIRTEVLMLFWKMIEYNEKFAAYVRQSEKILIILGCLLHYSLENKGNSNEIGLVRMCCFLIHILSQERSFAVQLNAPFDSGAWSVVTKNLPIFSQGCWGDFLFLALHSLLTTTGKTPVAALHENYLISLANASPYVKSLTVVTVNKLMSLFMSFSSAGFMLSNESNHKLVFYLLDIFNNMVQYQITGNTHLVYALVRHKDRFHDLQKMTFESGYEELMKIRALREQRQQKLDQAGILAKKPETPAAPPKKTEAAEAGSKESSEKPPVEETLSATGTTGDAKSPAESASTASTPQTASASEGGAPPELSEKAKGKLPASQSSASLGSVAGVDGKGRFVPTADWFNYWKSHLRLSVLISLVDTLAPPIETLCIEKGYTDEKQIIEYLQSGTLVGLLPLPHPLFTRKFTYTDPVRVWFTSYLWGCIFMKSASPPGGAEVVKLSPSIWAGKLNCLASRLGESD
ncbi:hypothetical protein HDV05_000832 [Chytridiales sp. JEL 0842]|nr:hypothetical protein HDV05_000832 [Chytridiales sp. JEL 0842]